MATAAPAPVSSTAEPAQLPALKAPHANAERKPKEKKGKQAATSEFPLEVCYHCPLCCTYLKSGLVATTSRVLRSPY